LKNCREPPTRKVLQIPKGFYSEFVRYDGWRISSNAPEMGLPDVHNEIFHETIGNVLEYFYVISDKKL
jgi:hypothetical protein